MTLSLSEIETTIRRSDPRRRHQTLRAVADMFLKDAASLDEQKVEVFDDLFEALLDETIRPELVELSEQFAPVPNAPPRLVKRLANDEEAAVATPVLAESPRLSTEDLCDIALSHGNFHLLAIATRRNIAEPVTDILLNRGSDDVARTIAHNRTARLSPQGVHRLAELSERDESIGAGLAGRTDISSKLFDSALAQSAERVGQNGAKIAAAQRAAVSLKQANKLDESAIRGFALKGEYEGLSAALAFLVNLRYQTLEAMMYSGRASGLSLICKSLGFELGTLSSVLALATSRNNLPPGELDQARREFVEVSRETANRIVRFWQVRQSLNPR
jgi:uncharacterized protein (DUF2336 family)